MAWAEECPSFGTGICCAQEVNLSLLGNITMIGRTPDPEISQSCREATWQKESKGPPGTPEST